MYLLDGCYCIKILIAFAWLYFSNGEKRLHSPDDMRQDFGFQRKRMRRRFGRPDSRLQDDMPRSSYGQGKSYDSGIMNMGGERGTMDYSNNSNLGYGRSGDMGSNRMYNTFGTSNRYVLSDRIMAVFLNMITNVFWLRLLIANLVSVDA